MDADSLDMKLRAEQRALRLMRSQLWEEIVYQLRSLHPPDYLSDSHLRHILELIKNEH
jgi:hypothetical protein